MEPLQVSGAWRGKADFLFPTKRANRGSRGSSEVWVLFHRVPANVHPWTGCENRSGYSRLLQVSEAEKKYPKEQQKTF